MNLQELGPPSTWPDSEFVGKKASLKILRQYWDVFHEEILSSSSQLNVDDLYQKFDVKSSTVKNHLRSFVDNKPEYLEHLLGFFPKPETILALAEKRNGLMAPEQVEIFNHYCKQIVEDISKPMHMRVIEEIIAKNIRNDGTLNTDSLALGIFGEYQQFVGDSGNGLMSIAGALNEYLLKVCLERQGLQEGSDFLKTGTDRRGDLMINSKSPQNPDQLYVEIKSYAARERLLRGLQDITGNKIGVGFFTNPAEFNNKRTSTLLKAQPMAIYMPVKTLSQMGKECKDRATTDGNRLYRALSRFASDMVEYAASGKLPDY